MIAGEGTAFQIAEQVCIVVTGRGSRCSLMARISQKLALQCEPVPIAVLDEMGFHGDLAHVFVAVFYRFAVAADLELSWALLGHP